MCLMQINTHHEEPAMSIDKVIAFGKLAMTDEKLRNELLTAVQDKDADDAAVAAATVAVGHGYEVTPAEVKEGYEAYLNMNKPGAGGELSEAQLAAIAGGKGPSFDTVAGNAVGWMVPGASNDRSGTYWWNKSPGGK
jgi:hypothetical protein